MIAQNSQKSNDIWSLRWAQNIKELPLMLWGRKITMKKIGGRWLCLKNKRRKEVKKEGKEEAEEAEGDLLVSTYSDAGYLTWYDE